MGHKFEFGKFKTVAEAAKALNDSGALKKKDHVKIQGLSEREILMAFFNAIEIIDSNDELGDLEDEIFEWYTNAVEIFNEDEEAAAEETNVVSLQEAKESKKKEDVKEVEVVEKDDEAPKAAKKVQAEEVEEAEVVEEAPKRRGRKAKVEVDEEDAEVVEEAPKRRGRKPKVEVDVETEVDVEEAEAVEETEDAEPEDAEPEVVEEAVEEKPRRRKVEIRARSSKAEVVEAQEPLPVEDVELDHSNIPPKPKRVVSRDEPAFTKAMGLMYKASMKGVEISVEELCKKTDAEEIYMKEVRRKMCNVLQFVVDNDLTMDEIQAILDNEPTPVRTGRPVDPMTEKRTIRRRD